jgi:hypothetical protein
MTKGILYYSDSQLPDNIASTCIDSIAKSNLPVVSVTKKPLSFGQNIVSITPKGYLSLFEDILMGLEASTSEVIFFAEADILYHPDHFEFIPERKDTIYYNGNYWVIRIEDDFAVHYDMGPLSGLCAFRETLLTHYRERVARVKRDGFDYRMGFEPMSHRRIKWDNMFRMERFYPEFPNLDLYHGGNLTRRKWSPTKFVTKPKFWEESTVENIPGWPDLPNIIRPLKKKKNI